MIISQDIKRRRETRLRVVIDNLRFQKGFLKKHVHLEGNTCVMKTKLTLTVRKSIINKAKRYSQKTGKSISRIFEEFFENTDTTDIKSVTQMAAERLLKKLESSSPVKALDDKKLLKKHVAGKFA